MKIFLSSASEYGKFAEEIKLALVNIGHNLFWDNVELKAGQVYNTKIRESVQKSDLIHIPN